MRKKTLISALLLIFLVLLTLAGIFYIKETNVTKAQDSAIHPRLLFTEDEIPGLKQKINDGLAYDDGAFDYIITFADNIITYSYPSQIMGGSYGIHNIPTLSIAYQLSDDSNPNKYTYRDKCKQAVLYIVDTYDHVRHEDPHWASHRLLSMSLGFDMCFDTATDVEKQKVITELESYMTVATMPYNSAWNLKEWRPYGNNGGVMAGSTLGLASIVLRGETANTALLDNSLKTSERILNLNLTSIFDEKGAYTEGALYAAWAMRFFVPYIEARVRYDGYDYGALPEVKNITNWMAYGVRPNKWSYINNLNDALYSTFPYSYHNTVIDWAQSKYSSEVAKWLYIKTISPWGYWGARDLWATVLYNNNISAVNPETVLPKSRVFPHRGLYYYRTGWPDVSQTESDDSIFSLYSGKFWSGHAQEDQGQFTLWSKGENFITDTGYGSKQSQAHNLVFINGLGQHNAGASCGTDGNIKHYLLNDFADFVHSDNKAAYNTYSEFNAPDYPLEGANWSWCYDGGNPVEKAERYAMSVKRGEVGEYFIIFDDIKKDANSNLYDWTWHTKYNNTVDMSSHPVTITGSNKGNILDLYFINPTFSDLSFSEVDYDNKNSDGHTKRISARVDAVNPEYFVLMFPKKTTREPTFNLTDLSVTNGYGAQLTWNNGYTDYLMYKKSGDLSAQNIVSNGKFTLVRKSGIDITKFSLSEGNSLVVDGINIVTAEAQDISVASDGETISVSDPSAVYTVYGPNVSSVVDNEGNDISFGTAGDYVYINTPAPDVIPPAAINDLSVS